MTRFYDLLNDNATDRFAPVLVSQVLTQAIQVTKLHGRSAQMDNTEFGELALVALTDILRSTGNEMICSWFAEHGLDLSR